MGHQSSNPSDSFSCVVSVYSHTALRLIRQKSKEMWRLPCARDVETGHQTIRAGERAIGSSEHIATVPHETGVSSEAFSFCRRGNGLKATVGLSFGVFRIFTQLRLTTLSSARLSPCAHSEASCSSSVVDTYCSWIAPECTQNPCAFSPWKQSWI